jgi:hypothetical protein
MAIQDVITQLNRLKASGVISEYAIGGAVAARTYIQAAATEDIDVFVVLAGQQPSSLLSLGPIYADLLGHGATAEGPYLVVGDWPVQFLAPGSSLYDEAIAAAPTVEVGGGVSARIMTAEHLAAIALDTGRPKDHTRLVEFVTSGVLNTQIFQEIVARFGLNAKWDAFREKFLT